MAERVCHYIGRDVEGKWFDLKYEKVPHFCFDCGRLVHSEGECQFEKGEAQQWGEWLHASPQRSQKPPSNPRPSVSIGSFSSRSMNSDYRHSGGITVRDIPPRRNLLNDLPHSNSSRTGEREERCGENDITSPDNSRRGSVKERLGAEAQGGNSRGGRTGTFVRKPRSQNLPSNQDGYQVPLGTSNKKRSSKMVWLPVPVRVVGEVSSESAGKKQRTTVFNRLEDSLADPARQGRRAQ
jgi:hypothetical protein